MRRTVGALLVSGLLLLTACKSPAERNSQSSGSSTTAAPSTEPGPGVTDDTVKLGVMYLDFSAVRDIIPSLDHGDYESAFKAVAKNINDAGGVDGRKIELVFSTIDPIDQSSAASACTHLIEDEKVFAVLAPQTNATAAQCILADHSTPLVGGVQTVEAVESARAPWFTWEATSAYSTTKTVGAVIDSGGLKGKKVAVVAASANKQVANDAAAQLKKAGISVTGVAVASGGISDQTAVRSELQTFAERFRADGAEAVVVVGETFVPFAQALGTSDYRPQLIATWTSNVLGFLVSATDHDVLKGLLSAGPPEEKVAFQQAPAQDCVKRVRAVEPDRSIEAPGGPTDGKPDTFVSVVQACKALDLFSAIASKAGKTLNADTFRNAGNQLGSIELPMLGGASNYSAKHPDGQPPMFLAHWDSKADELAYSDTPIS